MTQQKDRKRQIKLWLVGGVLLVFVVALGVSTDQSDLTGDDGGVVARGEDVPSLAFTTFEGGVAELADYEGQPVVLNFWASWCPACVAEMPDFEVISQRLGDEVVFVGLDTQDTSRDAANSLVHSTGVTYQLGLDPDGAIYRRFGGVGMPTTVFIDAEGRVVDVISGAIFAEDLEAKINELFFSNQALALP